MREYRNRKKKEYQFEGGVKSFIQYLNKNKDPIHKEPIYFEAERENVDVEVAIEYNEGL